MATLLQKSQEILAEKEAKILAGNIKKGVTAYGVTGTYTSDANAVAGEIYNNKTAYVDGVKVTGSNTWTDALAGGTITELEALADNILGTSSNSGGSSEPIDVD